MSILFCMIWDYCYRYFYNGIVSIIIAMNVLNFDYVRFCEAGWRWIIFE